MAACSPLVVRFLTEIAVDKIVRVVSDDQRGHGIEVYTISDRSQKREATQKLEAAVARKRQQRLAASA